MSREGGDLRLHQVLDCRSSLYEKSEPNDCPWFFASLDRNVEALSPPGTDSLENEVWE